MDKIAQNFDKTLEQLLWNLNLHERHKEFKEE